MQDRLETLAIIGCFDHHMHVWITAISDYYRKGKVCVCVCGSSAIVYHLTAMSEWVAHTFGILTLAIITTCVIEKGAPLLPNQFGGNTAHCLREIRDGTFRDFPFKCSITGSICSHLLIKETACQGYD